jgi:DNA-binding MarR family transcriptional regulator
MRTPQDILAGLGLNDSEIKTYLAMARGASAVRDIMKATRQKRPTVYYALSRLTERGLIRKTGRGAEERFAAEPPERLKTVAEARRIEAERLEKEVAGLVPSLAAASGKGSERPHVAFYEGLEAVKNVIMETLYNKGRHIDSIAPRDNFFWQVGAGFASSYVAERARRNIRTRNLWEAPIDPKQQRQEHYAGLSDIRILPVVMHGRSTTTIFLYDDKTLYISSLKNAYALLVTSQEHHDAMKALFDGLWSASKPASK